MGGDRFSRTNSCEKTNREEAENLQELSVCHLRLTQSEGEREQREGSVMKSTEGKARVLGVLRARSHVDSVDSQVL